MNNLLNISQIENWLHRAVRGTVSDNVAVGALPTTLKEGITNLVLIDVVESEDKTDFGRNLGKALVNIYLYASPTSTGSKPVATLNRMEEALAEALEDSDVDGYAASEMYGKSGYNSSIKWHYLIKAYRITID